MTPRSEELVAAFAFKKRFEDAVARLDPWLALEARQDAIRMVTCSPNV